MSWWAAESGAPVLNFLFERCTWLLFLVSLRFDALRTDGCRPNCSWALYHCWNECTPPATALHLLVQAIHAAATLTTEQQLQQHM